MSSKKKINIFLSFRFIFYQLWKFLFALIFPFLPMCPHPFQSKVAFRNFQKSKQELRYWEEKKKNKRKEASGPSGDIIARNPHTSRKQKKDKRKKERRKENTNCHPLNQSINQQQLQLRTPSSSNESHLPSSLKFSLPFVI